MTAPVLKFCSQCAAALTLRVPEGDHLPRAVCGACGHIHYENPRMVLGAVVQWEDSILLCRRAIEPRYGFWTVPAGFMENGESTGDAARRETVEEACAHIVLERLFSLVNLPEISQVHLFYLAHLSKPEFAPGAESLETALFKEADIPWQELSFSSVSATLRHYFADRKKGVFGFHDLTLNRQPAYES